ncbi:helix-turn-helix domain-containing protein [Pseudohalioglobus lutimaris]|uniref:HTH araC/xylS-type domain-containing protein n=1 Tax=Pseudohalioglobus lutimaris TaxID=1737061 RepID=A0A2N5WYB2_9GAMM|nr:AraC family transcriptional regulator [Pseudohalioglobus lutimaris]PLW67217.1 hypothetical protein C0039_17960 [Pseudohalioglobus lutimaris]
MLLIEMDATALCALLGLSLVGFIAPLLWFQARDNRRASEYLAVFVLIVGVSLLQTFLLHSGLTRRYPWVSGLGQFLFFALGPLLFLYTKTLTDREFKFAGNVAWHFLPVLFSLLLYLPVYLQTTEAKQAAAELYFAQRVSAEDQAYQLAALPMASKIYAIQFVALMFHLGSYAVLVLWQLEKHRRRIELVFSDIELINLNWLRWLNWLVLAVSLISLVFLMLRLFSQDPVSSGGRVVPVLVMFLLIYYAGWMGVRQPQIYGTQANSSDPGVEGGDSESKYHNTGLSAADADKHWQRLQHAMDEEQPYLRSGLTIKQLADTLGMSTAHLSQVINSRAQVTFFDYINSQRVAYAQRLLANPDQKKRKVLDIALSSGFSSESSFYAQFRKHAQCTPSQYRRQLQTQR